MKTWTETEETTTQLFEQFEGVIYHVMKKLNIQKNNAEYDDFLQKGRLLLLEAYQESKLNPLESFEAAKQFNSYLQRKLYWKFLNRITKKNIETVEFNQDWMQESENDPYWVEVEFDYREFFQRLTKLQMKTLQYLMQSDEPVSKYARRIGRTRSAVQQDILSIRKKMKKFLDKHSKIES